MPKKMITMEVRMDEDTYRKFLALSEAEHQTPNNRVMSMIRDRIQYYERVHGKLDTSKIVIESTESENKAQ